MAPGRPAKSEHEKALAGTQRPDRISEEMPEEHEPFTEMPPPPYWLNNPHAIYEWQRLGPYLLKLRRLHEGNIGHFASLCSTFGQCVAGWSNDMPVSPSLIGQYRALQGEFVLPASQRRRIEAPTAKKNEFANNAQGGGLRRVA